MSEIYDNWERLVERVLRQVKDRELCFQLSMSSNSNSSSSESDSISSSPLHHHHHNSVSPATPTPNLGKKIVFRVDLGDLKTMKGYFRGTDLLRLIGLCFAPHVRVRVDHVLLKACCSIHGVVYIALDPRDQKLTVIGDSVDPIAVMTTLRKFCHAEVLSVGPAKESDSRGGQVGDGITSMPSTPLPLSPHAS